MHSKIIHILFVVLIALSPTSVRAEHSDQFEPLQYTVVIGKPFESGILMENVTVINPLASRIEVFKGHVVIQNQAISYVGTKRPAVSKDVQRIDGKGKFVIPGLIDSHVHLANIAGMNGKFVRKYPELAESYYRQMPRSYLYFGYTTLIDLNNHSPKSLDSILAASIRPEILTCGEQVEVMNGFMMAETDPEDRLVEHPNFLLDTYNKNTQLPVTVAARDHTPKAAVRTVLEKQNGTCIKMAFENGFGGTEDVIWEMPTKEIVRDIVAEARKEKLPVLLHASSFEAQQFALDTGVDIIAHGMWHWGLLTEYQNVKPLPEAHRSLLKNISRNQVGYQPTFRVIAGQRDVLDDGFINDPNLGVVYPKEFLTWLKTDEGRWQQDNIKRYAKGAFDGKSNVEIAAFMQLFVDKINVSTKFLADNSANLLFGTDTPASNAHTNPPGYNGYLEMQEWFKAGISLKTILSAATINNASAFNIDKTHGNIKKGKVANLLILDKNPLRTVSAYDSINFVIINGKIVERKSLSAGFDDRKGASRNLSMRSQLKN